MPKTGFKTITLSESTYNEFYGAYEQQKENLSSKGVKSFAGYVTYMLEERMQRDKMFAKYAPKIEEIAVDSERVILKDNIKNRVAEIVIQNGEIYCMLCEEKDCVHVGFVFSIPDIYEVLDKKGIKR